MLKCLNLFTAVALLGESEQASDEVDDDSDDSLELALGLTLAVILLNGRLVVGLILGNIIGIGVGVVGSGLGDLITLGRATYLTGLRCLSGSVGEVVTLRCNNEVGIGLATVTGVGGVALIGAGGFGFLNLVGVTVSEYFLLCEENLTAYRALLTVGQARLGTSSVLALESPLGMSECLGSICNVAIVAVAGVGGVASLGAGRRSHESLVAMSKCRGLVSYVAVATYGADIIRVTAIRAVRRSYYRLVAVTERCYSVSNVAITALSTRIGGVATVGTVGSNDGLRIAMSLCRNDSLISRDLTAGQALLTVSKSYRGTGSSLAADYHLSVTERCNLVSRVSVAAYGAGVGGVAHILARRCSDYRNVAVSKCRKLLPGKNNVAAKCTLLTLGESCVGTSRSLSGDDLYLVVGAKILVAYVTDVVHIFIKVTVSRDKRLGNENLVTYGTYLTVGQAGLSTGGCLTVNGLLAVSERCNLVRSVLIATRGAGVGGIARLGAGGSGNCRLIAMLNNGNLLLSKNNLAAKRALLTLGESDVGTSRSLSGDDLYLVVGAKVLFAYVTDVILVSVGVSERLGLVAYGAYTAYRAGIGGVARRGTSGCGNYRLIVMTKLCDLLSIGVRRVVLANEGHSTLLVAGGINGYCALIPRVSISIKLTVRHTANGTYGVLSAGSSATVTLVRGNAERELGSSHEVLLHIVRGVKKSISELVKSRIGRLV